MMSLFQRHLVFLLCLGLSVAGSLGAYYDYLSFGWMVPFAALTLLGIYDIVQSSHAVLKNYPITGHMRFLLESIRPELRQYFFEADHEEVPYSRSARSMVYRRARGISADKSFGTLDNLYDEAHEFISHSIEPVKVDPKSLRITIGGPACTQPYSASLLNISAMSFGALSANAIRALGRGAKAGNFALDTGEGGLSRYHLEAGNDTIFEIGTGYFGCRKDDGTFDPEKFAAQAKKPVVAMCLLKISQGAKPSKGGMLPGAKVSKEIAEARGVPQGEDCISPSRHSAFSGPDGMMQFLQQMRELSGGKPVGFKLCVGHLVEVAALVKAMLHTGITPDFIVVDGSEGGTGAAPEEFSDHMGMPLRDGLVVVHNLLRGAGLRDKVKIIASGKIISGFDIVRILSLGADGINIGRGFMFALGCIGSQVCHQGTCPVGITTQDPIRQKALNVKLKGEMVYNFHKNTLISVADILGAAGMASAEELSPARMMRRVSDTRIMNYTALYHFLLDGELLNGRGTNPEYRTLWELAKHDSFH
jgi:glutamate synthase domain-containing protein 2